MKALKLLSALVIAIAISACSSGGLPDDNTTDAGEEPDAEVQAAPPADAGDTCEPGVEIIGGVPFGPAPPDVSNCKCGIGCHIIRTWDCKGYYCEYGCLACPQ